MPENDQGPNHQPDSSSTNTTLIESLFRMSRKGPLWLRTSATFVAILTALAPYGRYMSDWLEDRRIDSLMQTTTVATASQTTIPASQNPYASSNGIQVAPSTADPKTLRGVLNEQDAKHLSYHTIQLEEHPSFKRILVANKKEILAYSIYNSDGCMVIKHLKDGFIKTDLVRAEDMPPAAPPNAQNSLDPDFYARSIALKVSWEPPSDKPQTLSPPEQSPIQGGCLNPHPGQFRYWAGPPTDPCWGPIFRQFGDGCTHYQMFNHCNNVWDPAIHWTYCAAVHHP